MGRAPAEEVASWMRGAEAAAELAASSNGTGRLTSIRASEVATRRPEWVLDGRLALGALNLIVGRPGLGKSLELANLIAHATRGTLPGDLFGMPVTCLLASAEDDRETTLKPRLMAAGADLKLVQFLEVREEDGTEGALVLPDDVRELTLRASLIGAAIVGLDPVNAFLSAKIDSHRDTDLRRGFAPLARAAQLTEAAFVGVHHLNKGMSSDALTRVSGSVAFTAAPRSVLVLGADPSDPEGEAGSRRVLAHAKCNLGPRAPSLAYRIETVEVDGDDGKPIPTPRLVSDGESAASAHDLLAVSADDDERTARSEAAEFLRAELAGGPVRSEEIKRRAAEAGIQERTLWRAKKELQVKAEKRQDGWYWPLPEEGDRG